MKPLALLLAISFITYPAWSQSHSTPIPRGVRDGEQADAQAQRNIPPPSQQTPHVDPAKLQQDANELANLAASVPAAIDQANKGLVSKDLSEKLNRIEKLAKHLRGQLNP